MFAQVVFAQEVMFALALFQPHDSLCAFQIDMLASSLYFASIVHCSVADS